ncbi:hypothetical protein [Streptomyces sp. NPDC057382]|uniref:hypothetical protein n=1 Tax=unclassified Streptomyces TaxID=2593676 RepID=UPI003633B13D
MSDDYAALVTAIILAVLLIGTVQTYTLMRMWTDRFVETAQQYASSRRQALEAIRRGEEPAPDDLNGLATAVGQAGPMQLLAKVWPVLVGTSIWFGVCAVLVAVQIRILFWSATHQPETDPALAKLAFFVTAGSVALLILEVVIRVAVQLFSRLRTLTGDDYGGEESPEEKHALLSAVTAHLRGPQAPHVDAAPRTTADG